MLRYAHLFRRRLILSVHIAFAKVRINLFQSQPFRLGVFEIDQDSAQNIESHENEVRACADMGDSDRPYLADDDGPDGLARGCDTETFGADVGRENLKSEFLFQKERPWREIRNTSAA